MNPLQNLPKPRAIIYDWDNTLVDSWPLIQQSIDKTLIQMGHEPWGLEKVKSLVHKSMRESFPMLFGENWREAGKLYKQNYLEINLDINFLPQARQMIELIAKNDILQIVISNKIGQTLRQECKSLQVENIFFSIIGSGDANCDKPNKDPVDLALMGSGLDPKKDEIWFIGDTIADVECALNSDCRPIIFSSEKGLISSSIDKALIEHNKIPFYFDHQNMIDFFK